MSDLPVFIAGVIVGLVVGLIVGRLRQTEVIGPGPITNTLTARRASPAPPASASNGPASRSSRQFVGRQALLRRLATDLAWRRDRSVSSARRRDP
jgi:hypothetical protein